MANRKISDLTALTAPATGDLLPIVDISEAAAADKNKKITFGELLSSAPAGSAAAPSFSFDADPNTGIFNPAADTLAFAEGGTEAMRIDSSGRVLVGTSTANASGAKLQTSDGLTFPATAVASADPKTLDDYEEGTWTPVIVGTTTAGTATHNYRPAKYTKIGNLVTACTYIDWSSGTGTGNLRVNGLPFQAFNGATIDYSVAIGYIAQLTLPANSYAQGSIPAGTSSIALYTVSTAGGSSSASFLAYDSQAAFTLSATYYIS
jgi:hypothetical protein